MIEVFARFAPGMLPEWFPAAVSKVFDDGAVSAHVFVPRKIGPVVYIDRVEPGEWRHSTLCPVSR